MGETMAVIASSSLSDPTQKLLLKYKKEVEIPIKLLIRQYKEVETDIKTWSVKQSLPVTAVVGATVGGVEGSLLGILTAPGMPFGPQTLVETNLALNFGVWQSRAILLKLGLEEYGKNFKLGRLRDATLPLLTDRALEEVSIPLGPRLVILDHIQRVPEIEAKGGSEEMRNESHSLSI